MSADGAVVVGVDESPGARRALRWAYAEAEQRGASVEAVHAFRLEVAWIDKDDFARWNALEREAAERQLQQVLRDVPAPPGVHVVGRVVDDDAAAALIEASRRADLLVVGTRGRGGFSGLLLGSVSQRCVERAHCPVVVVPPLSGSSEEAAPTPPRHG